MNDDGPPLDHEFFSYPYVFDMDKEQVVPPSIMVGKMLTNEHKSHDCVRDYAGSSGGMEGTRLVHIKKKIP